MLSYWLIYFRQFSLLPTYKQLVPLPDTKHISSGREEDLFEPYKLRSILWYRQNSTFKNCLQLRLYCTTYWICTLMLSTFSTKQPLNTELFQEHMQRCMLDVFTPASGKEKAHSTLQLRNWDMLRDNWDSRYLGNLAMRFHPYSRVICAHASRQSSPQRESLAACWWPGKSGERFPATATQQSCAGSIPQMKLSL